MSDRPVPHPSPVVLLGGGIGAGKSRVASVFAGHGFTLIETDAIGRSILDTGTPAVAQIAQRWPETVDEGVVDRASLARIVFADPDALGHLEAITHPEIGRRVNDLVEATPGPVVVEVPVMKVLASEPYIRVAVVAHPAVREERAVARGGDRDDVKRRMDNQPSGAEWRLWADHVVDNSQEWGKTRTRVEVLVKEVLADD
jgi:dephospho-CoA kinase